MPEILITNRSKSVSYTCPPPIGVEIAPGITEQLSKYPWVSIELIQQTKTELLAAVTAGFILINGSADFATCEDIIDLLSEEIDDIHADIGNLEQFEKSDPIAGLRRSLDGPDTYITPSGPGSDVVVNPAVGPPAPFASTIAVDPQYGDPGIVFEYASTMRCVANDGALTDMTKTTQWGAVVLATAALGAAPATDDYITTQLTLRVLEQTGATDYRVEWSGQSWASDGGVISIIPHSGIDVLAFGGLNPLTEFVTVAGVAGATDEFSLLWMSLSRKISIIGI